EIFYTLFTEPGAEPGAGTGREGAGTATGGAGPVPRTLFLVGDPKQAIYSFRGGDVYTYLDARKTAAVTALTTNQRSDGAVLAAMNALAAGHTYGEASIAYQPVDVAPRNRNRRAVGTNGEALPGLQIRSLEPTPDGGIAGDAP